MLIAWSLPIYEHCYASSLPSGPAEYSICDLFAKLVAENTCLRQAGATNHTQTR